MPQQSRSGRGASGSQKINEAELSRLKVDELRGRLRELGVTGTSSLRKEELVKSLVKSLRAEQRGTGSAKKKEPERPGRTLVTTDHEVIRQWARERDAVPATIEGTEHGDHLGVLTFNFPGGAEDRLREVSWDEWFDTFDRRGLNFIYQEQRADGRQSNFFRLENPEREDA